ncbi:MAG TPA: efflux RND transporter periplasmic adaptor subunit [Vicinamibacterales bacterium]|nr:efflux RND transporter periplasmic adaptor subunit [Vicinamibacterales bacterium]
MKPFAFLRRINRGGWIAIVLLPLIALGAFAAVGRGSAPDLPTIEVTKGEFVDALEIRGDIKPLRSVVLAAPMQAGELQIVKLAKGGTMVKAGEVVVEFDGSTLRRTMQEKQSELKQADAEIEQATAQTHITKEQNATELMRANYNIQRAKLEVQKAETVPRIDNEKAKLTLADTEQKLKELQAKIKSDETSIEADLSNRRRKREKALFDLQRAERGLQNLQLKAPVDGMVNVLPNYRAGGPFGGGEVEFREGDRAWAGAAVVELPDLSSIHLQARLDETDRGRLTVGEEAVIRIDAVPGRDFKARIDRISVLARADFSSWPPTRLFDLGLVLLDVDSRIRPGMAAVARIPTDRVPNVILVPTESVFQRDGRPVVYRLDGTEFEERHVDIARRGREFAIIKAGVEPGDRVATRRPGPELVRRAD